MQPQLAALVKSGDVTFTYKHMPVVGDRVRSTWAAQATECAADQGNFWAYHDYLFDNQGKADFTQANLKTFAGKLGLDTNTFGQCLDSKKYANKVSQDAKDGVNLGLKSTPSFVINGKPIQLKQSWNEVVQAVQEELKKK